MFRGAIMIIRFRISRYTIDDEYSEEGGGEEEEMDAVLKKRKKRRKKGRGLKRDNVKRDT